MTSTAADLKKMQELEWVQLEDVETQTSWGRTKAKFLSNPLIPIGCIATAGILGRGLFYCYKGDGRMQQKFMRYRVMAQGATLILVCISLALNMPKL